MHFMNASIHGTVNVTRTNSNLKRLFSKYPKIKCIFMKKVKRHLYILSYLNTLTFNISWESERTHKLLLFISFAFLIKQKINVHNTQAWTMIMKHPFEFIFDTEKKTRKWNKNRKTNEKWRRNDCKRSVSCKIHMGNNFLKCYTYNTISKCTQQTKTNVYEYKCIFWI